jgi:hypothetical protein
MVFALMNVILRVLTSVSCGFYPNERDFEGFD